MNRRFVILLATTAVSVFGGGLVATMARADVGQTMLTELQAAGVPSPVVSIVTPAPATAADVAAFDADPGTNTPSLSNDNLISPDPTAPLPVARIGYGNATATPIPGFVSPPGGSTWASVEDAQDPIWRLAIVSALKHALASGASLAGLSMAPRFPNRNPSGAPTFWTTPPNAKDLPATKLVATMPTGSIRTQVQSGLPVWAQLASVDVTDTPASERRVTVSLQLSVIQYPLTDIPDLIARLLDQQLSLNKQGAAIGSVVVSIHDISDGQPLMTYAGDASWGQHFVWTSPQTAGFASMPNAGIASDPSGDAQQAASTAQRSPDPSGLVPPTPLSP
jgi:hypothetical protein